MIWKLRFFKKIRMIYSATYSLISRWFAPPVIDWCALASHSVHVGESLQPAVEWRTLVNPKKIHEISDGNTFTY